MKKEKIAEKIKAARQRLGISQQTLSDLTGISRPHISEMENAKRGIGPVYTKKLAKALQVPVSYFQE